MRKLFLATALAIESCTLSAQGVFDDFERSNLGSNWTIFNGAGSVEIVNNSDIGYPSSGYFTVVAWNADTFSTDQYSEAQYSPNRIDSMLGQVFVRRRASDFARYGFHWDDRNGGRYEIKYDGVATPDVRILAFQVAPEPLGGDTMRIEIEGMTIKGYHNGDLVLTATDTAFISSNPITTYGPPGMAFRFTISFPPVYPTSVFEWWGGGSYVNTTGYEEIYENDNLILFPNPSSGKLTIQSAGNLTVSNMLGEIIYSTKINEENTEIDLGNLAEGIYYFQVQSKGQVFSRKIIIQN